MPAKKLYRLNDGDRQIMEKARVSKNPNWFTRFYLSSPDSGTYFRPVYPEIINKLRIPEFKEKARKWADDYFTLFSIWREIGQPRYFGCVNPFIGNSSLEDWFAYRNEEALRESGFEHKYRVIDDPKYTEPVFHNPHGFQYLNWALGMRNAKQFLRVVIGGYGGGKTLNAAAEPLEYAATLKRFRALVLAPEMKQANDIFFSLQRLIEGTEYEKRFLIGAPQRYTGTNHPALILGSAETGKNTIEFLPIADNVEKIKTFTNVDYILVDQAEQIDDLDTLIEVAGTRQRGQEGGREKLGIITLLANSADATVWEKFDQAEEQPDEIWTYQPSSAENIYLTVPDMLRYETHIGNDPDAIKMAIFGARPKGKGEIFTPSMLESFHADWLDNRSDAEIVKIPKAGVVKWLLPPVEGRTYLVTADSGQENPPKRNSAVIGIWDITNFPHEPASLWGFDWVISNGSSDVWLARFTNYMLTYKTTLGAWDATGPGNAYNNPSTGLTLLGAVPIQMGGTLKNQYIGLAQLIMSQGKFRAARIEGIFGQLSRYILPEKHGMAQDCVAMILVTAAWLKALFFAAQLQQVEETPERIAAAYDRWNRPEEMDRYGGYIEETPAIGFDRML